MKKISKGHAAHEIHIAISELAQAAIAQERGERQLFNKSIGAATARLMEVQIRMGFVQEGFGHCHICNADLDAEETYDTILTLCFCGRTTRQSRAVRVEGSEGRVSWYCSTQCRDRAASSQ
jgi:hypothetical protein